LLNNQLFPALLLLVSLLTACHGTTGGGNAEVNMQSSKSQQNHPQPLTYSTKSYVLAEPVHGRNLKISISAKEKNLYIANCNQFIVVALYKRGSENPVWGGSSNACSSQSIIIPAKSTLSFIVPTGENAPDLDTSTPYKANVFGVFQVPRELVTSNEFKLIP
jgi:hypothetical protein